MVARKKELYSQDNENLSHEEREETNLQPTRSSPPSLNFKPQNVKEFELEEYENEKILIKKHYKKDSTLLNKKLEELDQIYEPYLKKNFKVDTNEFIINKENGSTSLDIDAFCDFLMKNYSFKTTIGLKNEVIYVFDKGVWVNNGNKIIKEETERILKQYSKLHNVQEIFSKIKRKTYIDTKEFNELPYGKICLSNCVYDLNTGTTEAFNSKYYFKNRFNIMYDVNAKCPNILKFFDDTFYESNISTIQEWLGFCFLNKYNFKKALMLHGDTNTGKTVFMNIIIKLFGINNISALSLQKLAKGKSFDMVGLKDRFINLYDDLNSDGLKHTGVFKMATGGSIIHAEYKFGDVFEFFTFAKLVFACNKIPSLETDEEDMAYYDKWLLIACDNVVGVVDRIPNFEEGLCSVEELSGLFNWSMKGYDRLVRNNKFSFDKSPVEVKELMKNSSNSLYGFVSGYVKESVGCKVSKADFYELYYGYCKSVGNPNVLSIKQITSRLKSLAPFVRELNNKGVRYWYNLVVDMVLFKRFVGVDVSEQEKLL